MIQPDVISLVDSHVHLWDLSHPTLRWDWLAPQLGHPILGDIEGIKAPAFTARHLRAESRFAGVSAYVHVQAALGSPDPVEETRWLTEMGTEYGLPQAIIGHVDLRGGDAVEVLDAHQESMLFRGVRDFSTESYVASVALDTNFENALHVMQQRELVLDLDCEYPNMGAAADLAARHPDLQIVLEHLGYPRRRDQEYFAAWRRGVGILSEHGNVSCKLSGVAMTDPLFTDASLTPWVEAVLETFGPDRCMIGTNWPVDRLFSSYDSIIAFYRRGVSMLSIDEQRAVLNGNATRLYRL